MIKIGNFSLVMKNNVKNSKEEFKKFLIEVFSLYKGHLKLMELDSITVKKDYYRINLSDSYSHIKLSFSPWLLDELALVTDTDAFSKSNYSQKEIQIRFFDLIDLAIAMMKTSGNDFFIGSFESDGIKPEQGMPIELLFFKTDQYLTYLKKHLKLHKKLVFP